MEERMKGNTWGKTLSGQSSSSFACVIVVWFPYPILQLKQCPAAELLDVELRCASDFVDGG